MKRAKLRNEYVKSRNEEDCKNYTKQINYLVKLLRKTKWSFYKKLDEKRLIDNRKFWKPVKPMLTIKQ